MGQENNRLIKFTKAWNFTNGGYGEKEYWFNPAVEVKGIEECKLDNNGKEVVCVKIFYPYPDRYVVLVGSIENFFKQCSDLNVAICLIQDLYKEGFTIKQFMEQNGKLNDMNLV